MRCRSAIRFLPNRHCPSILGWMSRARRTPASGGDKVTRLRLVTAALVLAAATWPSAAGAALDARPERLMGVNGLVRTIAVDGTTLYVGGNFTEVGRFY